MEELSGLYMGMTVARWGEKKAHTQPRGSIIGWEGGTGGVWRPPQNDTRGRRERETIYADGRDARARQR